MLALRRKALGLKPAVKQTVVEDSNKLATLRKQVKTAIEKVQNEFWSLPIDQLKRKLEAIPVNKLPELRPIVSRLRTAASCRAQFPLLAQDGDMDMNLFRAFKSSVVLPPAEAGYHRERFLQSITDKKQLKSVKRSVASIRSNHPVLYEMEKDWFETIQNLKKPKVRSVSSGGGEYYESDGGFEFGWGTWICVIILIRVFIRILMSWSG